MKRAFLCRSVLGSGLVLCSMAIVRSSEPSWDSYRLYLHGLLAERAGQTAQAMEDYREVLRQDPTADFIKESLAGLADSGREASAAIQAYERSLETNPDDLEVLIHLGQLYYLSHRFEEAGKAMDRALLLAPQNPGLHFWRALVAEEEGHWEEAAQHMEVAAKGHPDAGVLLRLSTYYSRLNRRKDTVRILKRLQRQQPDNPDFMYFLGLAYEDAERPRAAIRWLDRASKKESEPLDVDFHLALNWDKLGRFDQSEKHLLRAIERNPRNALALNYLGYSWADRNVRLEEALALVQRAVAEAPENMAFRDSLGWAYFRLGRLSEAESVLASAVYPADDPVVWSHYGDVLDALGRRPEAIRAWQEGLLSGPNDRDLLKKLGDEGRFRHPLPLSAPRTLLKRVEGNYRQVAALSGMASVRVRAEGRTLSGQGLFYYARPNLFRLEVMGPLLVPQGILIYDGQSHWSPAVSTSGEEGPWLALWGEVLSGEFFKAFDDPSVQVRQEGTDLIYASSAGELRLDARKKSVVEAKRSLGSGETVSLTFGSPRVEEGLVLPRVVEGKSRRSDFAFTLDFSRWAINPSLAPTLFVPAP